MPDVKPNRPERRPLIDPSVAELLETLENKQAEQHLPRRERSRRTREREKIAARREARVTYDRPPALRQKMADLAQSQGVPASQLVTLALLRFLKDLGAGQVALGQYKQPSHSPRYDWNLVFSEEDFTVLDEKPAQARGKKKV